MSKYSQQQRKISAYEHHDYNYFGIKHIQNLYNDEIIDYYKPTLARSSFEHNYGEYEIRGDKNKNLTLKPYLYINTTQLAELINEKKNSTQSEQKVQLIISVIFKHVMDPTKKCNFYDKSKTIEMRSGDNTDDIIIKLLESFLENYEREENILRNGIDYVFDGVNSTLVYFHTIELRRGSSYNPQNRNGNCCFPYSIIAALHHQDISHDPQRIIKFKPYISDYNWKDIDFAAGSKEYKIFERNNQDIALNILSVPHNKKEINII